MKEWRSKLKAMYWLLTRKEYFLVAYNSKGPVLVSSNCDMDQLQEITKEILEYTYEVQEQAAMDALIYQAQQITAGNGTLK